METRMQEHHTTRVQELPEYQELLRKRRALTVPLLLLIVVAYFAFILLIAFDKESLGQPIGDGVISVGIVAGLGLIFLTFSITVVYVRRANAIFQPLIDAIATKIEEKPHA